MLKNKVEILGSLEELVENLVKTWEMEASHKSDFLQWKTVDHEKYCLQMNGGRLVEANEATTMGNYNALMLDSKEYQKCKNLHFSDSQ